MSVDKTLKCDHSNESYRVKRSGGAVLKRKVFENMLILYCTFNRGDHCQKAKNTTSQCFFRELHASRSGQSASHKSISHENSTTFHHFRFANITSVEKGVGRSAHQRCSLQVSHYLIGNCQSGTNRGLVSSCLVARLTRRPSKEVKSDGNVR